MASFRMSGLLAWVKGNPTRVAAIATVLLGWAAAAGVPDLVVGGLGTILAVIVGGPVYNAVAPVAKVVETTRTAALDAAAQVASRLDAQSAGPIGTITDHGVQLADTAANSAADAALRAAGIKWKDRAK